MNDTEKLVKTFDFKVTTREETWTRIYASAVEAGFNAELALKETDKAIDLIFSKLGPELEEELRAKSLDNRLRPRTISFRPPSRSSN